MNKQLSVHDLESTLHVTERDSTSASFCRTFRNTLMHLQIEITYLKIYFTPFTIILNSSLITNETIFKFYQILLYTRFFPSLTEHFNLFNFASVHNFFSIQQRQNKMLPRDPTFIPIQPPSSNKHIRPSITANADSPIRNSFRPAAQTIPASFLASSHQVAKNKSSSQSFSNSDSPPYNPMNTPVCTQDFLRIPKRIFNDDRKNDDPEGQSPSKKKKPFVPRAEHKKYANDEIKLATENNQLDRKISQSIKIKILKDRNEDQDRQGKTHCFLGQNFLITRNKTQTFQSLGPPFKARYRMSEMPLKNHNFSPAIPEQTQLTAKERINTMLSTQDIHSSFGPVKNYLVPDQKKGIQLMRSNSKRKHYVSVTPTKFNKNSTPTQLKSVEKVQKSNFVPSKKSVSRFKIIKLIGSSKFSEAYICRDKKSNSIYCLKKIKKSLINQSPALLNQFIRKIGLQFRSVHPNIIQIYDVFCDQEFVYLVEEYMQSGSLRDFLNDEKQGKNIIDEIKGEQAITEKLYNINSGLNYIHNVENERKIKDGPRIHGDLRPETVLINFGCCKISPINPIKIEKTVSLLHPYVCPQALVEQTLTAKSDMWNLGLILYELCARRPLFRVQSSKNEMSLADQIVNMDYNKQILNIQFVTHPLKDLVRKLLMVRPDERLSSSDLMNSSVIRKRGLQAKQLGIKNNQSEPPEMQNFRRQIKAQNNNFPKYQYNPTRLNNFFPGGVDKN